MPRCPVCAAGPVCCGNQHLYSMTFSARGTSGGGNVMTDRHCPSRPMAVRQLARLRTTSPGPSLRISQRRSVSIIAAIAADFPAHRRRRVAQRPRHRSGRSMRRNAPGYLLAFRERQCQPRPAPCRRAEFRHVAPPGNKWTMTVYQTPGQSLSATFPVANDPTASSSRPW